MAITTPQETVIVAQEDPALGDDTTTTGNTVYSSDGVTYVTTVENYNNTYVTTNTVDSPGGVNFSVQYNDNGVLSGSDVFTFSPESGVVRVPGLVVANGADLGNVATLTIRGGNTGEVLTTNGNGVLSWGVGGGGGGNTAAGGNAQIQFNSGGVLAANSQFTWNLGVLSTPVVSAATVNVSANTVSNGVTVSVLRIGNTVANTVAAITSATTATTVGTTANVVIWSQAASGVTGARWTVVATDGTTSRRVSEIGAAVLSTTVNSSEWGIVSVGADPCVLSVDISGGQLRVLSTPLVANTVNYSVISTVYN